VGDGDAGDSDVDDAEEGAEGHRGFPGSSFRQRPATTVRFQDGPAGCGRRLQGSADRASPGPADAPDLGLAQAGRGPPVGIRTNGICMSGDGERSESVRHHDVF
jgi:hypothetical protein